MSAFGGSNIVTNGLVLCLDAANIKSYPGSGTTWTDLSGLGNNGSIKAGAAYNSLGWFNFNHLSSDFNGYNGYIDAGNPTSLQLSSDITIETWINPDSTTGKGNMVSKNGNDGYRYRISPTGQIEFFARGGENVITGGTVPNGAWSHCVVTGDSSGLKVYVNGTLVASNSTAYSPYNAQNGNLTIGIDIQNAERFDGKIAVCKIYNRALTATEIKQSYNATRERYEKNTFSTIAKAAPGLICALDPANLDSWPAAGATMADLTGQGNNFAATVSDFATYNGQNVLRLDGSAARRAITGLNITLPYTILGVSRYNGLGSNRRVRTISSNTNNWLMNHWNNTKARYYAEGWITAQSFGDNNADNNWQIGIVTGATRDYHAYFDGTTDSAITPTAGTAAPGAIAFGGWGAYNESSNCDIGLFLVWNRVLTQTEINTVYNIVRQRFGQ